MIISVRGKANFFYFRNFAFCLHIFFTFLLFIKKLVVVNYFTNGRISLRRNFYQVKSLFVCNSLCFCSRINSYFNIFANQSYLRYSDHLIGTVFLLLFFFKTWIKCASWRSWWKCHYLILGYKFFIWV